MGTGRMLDSLYASSKGVATGAAHSNSLSLVCSGIEHASSSISRLSGTRQSLGNYFHLNWKLSAELPPTQTLSKYNYPQTVMRYTEDDSELATHEWRS